MRKWIILGALPALLCIPGESSSRGFVAARPRPAAGGFYRPGGVGPSYSFNRGPVNVNRPVYNPQVNFNRPQVNNFRPGLAPVTRPNVVNRPIINQPTNIANRTAIGNRTNINSPTNIGNRFNNINVNNRTNTVVNRPTNVVNRPTTVNQNVINRNTAVVNRSGWNYNRGWGVNRPWYGYYRGYHGDWHHGYWNRWNWRPWTWAAGAASLGWLAAGTTNYVYQNPFYVPVPVATPVEVPVYLNYSQPIPQPPALPDTTADPNATDPPDPPAPDVPPAVTTLESGARAAFKKGDYAQAQNLIEQAIQQLPSDATLHEFRALCQFAQKDYQGAAATIFAVLAAGPGWDWATMSSLYADPATYTMQLRALEAYQKAHPEAGYASFLLAYQYLVLDHPEAAVKQLENVVKLDPKDELASRLLQAIKAPATAADQPPAPGT